ncbi:transcription termination factor MTERF6, chloroplastic/mitochondrial-like [Lycium barbarum]|uniref:transcription termination factor MTERF6, chloroplastic/mitochondrial-like n=1 Tax=Lycium barbarum TaxID=112863 RepID=UPI00293ECD31|nr:transcription termination factor MTERF6, chloroplastic/mitochondrial-like [Lycium barbarum]
MNTTSPLHLMGSMIQLAENLDKNLNPLSQEEILLLLILQGREYTDLVLNFLKQTGLDKAQMKEIVSRVPKLLFYDVSKTLKPKFQCLMDLGLSGSDLVNVIAKDTTIVDRGLDTHLKPTIDLLRRTLGSDENIVDKTLKPKLDIFQEIGLSGTDLYKFMTVKHNILRNGLDTCIRPSLDYLRNLLGSDENVVKALKKNSWLLRCNAPKTIATNVLLLQDTGLSDEKIRKFILRYPAFSLWNCCHHFVPSVNFNKEDYGWSDENIRTMIRKQPSCLRCLEATICKHLTFLMNEVGCTSEYLASRPNLLKYSLEKRIIPRYKVLKIFIDKLLKKGVGIYSAAKMTPSKFMEECLLPYKDKIPIAYESYMKSVG